METGKNEDTSSDNKSDKNNTDEEVCDKVGNRLGWFHLIQINREKAGCQYLLALVFVLVLDKIGIMDISKIANPLAKAFVDQFLRDREINKEFYKRVPEDKFDFRMVDVPQRKSDSPRESLIHQIDTTRDYVNGIKTGTLRFGIKYDDLTEPQKMTKDELLLKLEESEKELIEILSDPEINNRKVQVPWGKEPIPAVTSLWALDSHEILHQGWNLAIMDHLNIERFPVLKAMWGE